MRLLMKSHHCALFSFCMEVGSSTTSVLHSTSCIEMLEFEKAVPYGALTRVKDKR